MRYGPSVMIGIGTTQDLQPIPIATIATVHQQQAMGNRLMIERLFLIFISSEEIIDSTS